MPIYDPKGTHWARYTTTQHGPMPVKAAAGVKSANALAARPGVSNYQLKKAVATPEAKQSPTCWAPWAATARSSSPQGGGSLADGQYMVASDALKLAARGSVQKSYGACMIASSMTSPQARRAVYEKYTLKAGVAKFPEILPAKVHVRQRTHSATPDMTRARSLPSQSHPT